MAGPPLCVHRSAGTSAETLQQHLGQLKSPADAQQRDHTPAHRIDSKLAIRELQMASLNYSEKKLEVKLHTVAWINFVTC